MYHSLMWLLCAWMLARGEKPKSCDAEQQRIGDIINGKEDKNLLCRAVKNLAACKIQLLDRPPTEDEIKALEKAVEEESQKLGAECKEDFRVMVKRQVNDMFSNLGIKELVGLDGCRVKLQQENRTLREGDLHGKCQIYERAGRCVLGVLRRRPTEEEIKSFKSILFTEKIIRDCQFDIEKIVNEVHPANATNTISGEGGLRASSPASPAEETTRGGAVSTVLTSSFEIMFLSLASFVSIVSVACIR